MMGLFHSPDGKVSMMRAGFFACLIIGALMCLTAMWGFVNAKAESVALANAGALLMGSSSFAKGIQSKWEKKE